MLFRKALAVGQTAFSFSAEVPEGSGRIGGERGKHVLGTVLKCYSSSVGGKVV